MKTKLITASIFSAIISVGQNNMEIKEISLTTTPEPQVTQTNSEDIYTVVEEMPKYPGGQAEMEKFIQTNLVFPKTAIQKNINGKCYIKITLKPDGSVYEPKVLKGVADCPECDTEALRVISMMPKWIPAKQNGKTVSVYYNLPINFVSTPK